MRRFGCFAVGLVIAGAICAWAEEPAEPAVSTVTVHTVRFEGNRVFTDAQLQERISLAPGKSFSPDQLAYSQSSLKSFYQDQGYFTVQISTRVQSVVAQQVNVIFPIEEGPLYKVGEITVEGNKTIDRKIIDRAFKISPGDPFSQTKVFNGNKNLYLTGFFRSLDVQYSTAAAHVMNIHLRVVENPTRFIKGSAGYGAESKERVSLGYEDRNFFGNARNFSTTLSYSGFLTNPAKYQTVLGVIGLGVPNVWHTKWDAQNSISQEWARRESYDTRTTAFRTRVGRRLKRDWRTDFGYRYEGTQLYNPDPSLSETAGFTNVSALRPGVSYDTTDDAFLPTNGWRGSADYEQGFDILIGNLRFYKWETKLGHFNLLPGRWTSFVGAQFAVERPDDTGTVMPIFERFTLGGANTVRGYPERTLGPKDAQGNPAGGEAFVVSNIEMRHPIYKKLWGIMFLDGGQLYERTAGEEWPHIHLEHFSDLRWSTGTGLRLQTPVGAIRLEFGYQLNPETDTQKFLDRAAAHFTLGENF